MTDRDVPDRSAVRELAKRLGKRALPPVVMTGSVTPVGHSDDVDITGLPMPIGSVGQVLTIVDVSGDTIPQWADPSGGALMLDDLEDVDVLLPDDGDVLMWSASENQWIAAASPISGRYRSPLYSTYGGGDLVWDDDGHLMYTLEALE